MNVPPNCNLSTINTYVGGYIYEEIECIDYEEAELSGTIQIVTEVSDYF